MRKMIFAIAIMACGTEAKPAPSCQQAMGHFYGAHCFYFDATKNPPPKFTLADMVLLCQNLTIQAPASCQDEIDSWLTCNAAVIDGPIGGMDGLGDPRCDCSQTQMALLRCQ